ncbi:hypothetical protein VIBNISOn1_p0152 [Vibrio nigripulchritudo SOn1]|uniref:Uncharacterized protein n=1 Tax=Vibrio nigripulchritudo SOn1 TaxID=1238450 RepID=A0AAV2VZW2_9VIBR|nr:hypothetical protein VIBNISOn1_p0152 [Vibrio nigripulchritudo SOn1]
MPACMQLQSDIEAKESLYFRLKSILSVKSVIYAIFHSDEKTTNNEESNVKKR